MKVKIFICGILLFFGLSSIAQTTWNFKYNCFNLTKTTHASVYLKYLNNTIELFNDTIRKYENNLSIPITETEYVLSVEFEYTIKNKNSRRERKKGIVDCFFTEKLEYPFTLVGNETDIEIHVRFFNDWQSKKESGSGSIKVIKFYESNHDIEIQYLPKEKGDEYFRAPFFMLKNNSNDTIYGQFHPNYFWGSISFLVDTIWSPEYFGRLDMNFEGNSPLFPNSIGLAWVGSFGWQNELPKSRYKYTLLYTTDRKKEGQYAEKNNFVWWADTKKYYRLIYEFDVE